MNDYNRSEQLKSLHIQRRFQTDNKANSAIEALLEKHESISFRRVSEVSGISTATLYKHENIRKRIEKLRSETLSSAVTNGSKNAVGDSSKDALIASLKRKIKALEAENKRLRELNEQRLAEEWDKL